MISYPETNGFWVETEARLVWLAIWTSDTTDFNCDMFVLWSDETFWYRPLDEREMDKPRKFPAEASNWSILWCVSMWLFIVLQRGAILLLESSKSNESLREWAFWNKTRCTECKIVQAVLRRTHKRPTRRLVQCCLIFFYCPMMFEILLKLFSLDIRTKTFQDIFETKWIWPDA